MCQYSEVRRKETLKETLRDTLKGNAFGNTLYLEERLRFQLQIKPPSCNIEAPGAEGQIWFKMAFC